MILAEAHAAVFVATCVFAAFVLCVRESRRSPGKGE